MALKAVGLLSAMAQSGCPIPAAPGSVLPWMDHWVVSLGDEQSLEHDLSTFAAHLSRWGEALALAGPRTMVLLDELGSGTDPVEGAALGQSVLERLAETDTLGLITTHLGTLKGFAADTAGMKNASMVFDGAGGRPTYRMAVGVPGESHALDMARHLGFPPERVARAEALLPREERDLRKLLGELAEERDRLSVARDQAEAMGAEAGRLADDHRQRLERILQERAGIRARAARQGREILRRAEERVRQAERAAREGEVGQARDLVREQAKLARLEEVVPRRQEGGGGVPDHVETGKRYWAEALGREVEVVRGPDAGGRVLVVQGNVRVELPLNTLRKLGKGAPEPDTVPRQAVRVSVPETDSVSPEIHLRGLRADEAISELDKALDRAMLAGLEELRVVHGKGTGALRAAVLEFCRGHAAVRSVRTGEQGEGGAGVTVVRLEG